MPNLTSPQSLALLFGGLSICHGIRALVSPHRFADDFGFPTDVLYPKTHPDLSSQTAHKPFVTAFGGRTIAVGAAIVLLALEEKVNAAGTVILCCAVSGMIDTLNCLQTGRLAPVLQHATGTLVLATLGIWLRSK